MFTVKRGTGSNSDQWNLCREEKVIAGPFDSKPDAESMAMELAKQQPDNALVLFDLLLNATPLTVIEFLELQMPGRSGSAEFELLKPYLVEMMNILTLSDLALVDRPITEGSVIHGITETGHGAYLEHLRSYALKHP